MTNKNVIYAKIENLRRCVSRIQSKTPSDSLVLLEDYDIQDIISINLERAIQVCVDIASHIIADSDAIAPDSMKKSFNVLSRLEFIDAETADKLIAAVGFRNIAVHAYQEVDWNIVYSIITKELSVFNSFAKQIVKKLEND